MTYASEGRPDLILADKPLAAVDPVTTERVMEALLELNGEGATLLVDLHDVKTARRFPRVVALACLRFGLPAHQGRGVDDLPPEETDLLTDALVVSLEPSDLHRAFASAVRLLLKEACHIDVGLASRLASPLEELVCSSDSSPQSPRS